MDEIESIQSILSSIPHTSGEMERNAALDLAEKKLRNANGTKRSFKMETRLVSEPNQRRRYENQLSRHEEQLAKLRADLKALRADTSRDQLFLGAKTEGDIEMTNNQEKAGDDMLADASRLQDKTQSSLDNTKNMIAESKAVGMQTVEELERQRQQIQTIDEEVMNIEDNLTRADKLIKTFAKRMATDKMFQCFACVNVLLLVGVILYAVIGGGGLAGSKDSGEPESPVRMLRGYSNGINDE